MNAEEFDKKFDDGLEDIIDRPGPLERSDAPTGT